MKTSCEQIRELIEKLNEYTKLYDEGNPIISDEEWDNLYFKLQKLENDTNTYFKDSPTQKITYQVVNELKKVSHNHPMLSLDKTKNWGEFLDYFSNINSRKDVVGMLKLDGLTCSLKYDNGKLISAETRGDGVIGEDVFHNALTIKNIPKKIDYPYELIVDGEIICDKFTFKQFENEYANPRNFASGSIRLQDSKECEKRGLKFILWNVVKGPYKSVICNFEELQKWGFTITPWTSSFDWDAKEFLINKAEEYGYPIDGLVGRFDDQVFGESLGATGHHSRAAYAFKFADEKYETWLSNIEWTMGRTGVLTPVAVFEPVDTGDSIIERASLHNISIMEGLLGYAHKNQPITIFKANDIIPQVSKAENKEYQGYKYYENKPRFYIPTECPICGGQLKIACEVDTEILVCTNENCEGKLLNRLEHFAGKKGLDIKGLSKATFEKLIDWGWIESYTDLFELSQHKEEWIKKSGFGIKSVEKILESIELKSHCELQQFIAALGIPLIGTVASKELSKHFTTWDKFMEAVKNHFAFYDLPNFGIEMHNSIVNFNYNEACLIAEHYIIFGSSDHTAESANLNNKELLGKTFVITGKLNYFKNRDEIKEKIESLGGKVSSSVSKNTNYLINNDIMSTSGKNKQAKSLGIEVISEEKFINDYLKNF